MGRRRQRRATAATPTAVWLVVSVLVGGCAISAVDPVTGCGKAPVAFRVVTGLLTIGFSEILEDNAKNDCMWRAYLRTLPEEERRHQELLKAIRDRR